MRLDDRLANVRQVGLRRPVGVEEPGLPAVQIALIDRVEQVETTHVGLAEGKLNRVAVVLPLYRLRDRFDRRRLDARVFARLCRRYLRLDAELVVAYRERRSALHSAVKCDSKYRNELAAAAER